jgi:hypothetical protein
VPFSESGTTGKRVLAASLPKLQRADQLFADPLGLQPVRADHDGEGRRFLDRPLDLGPQRIAAAKLARVDPAVPPEIVERGAEIAHERVVLRAVRDEDLAHDVSADDVEVRRTLQRRVSRSALSWARAGGATSLDGQGDAQRAVERGDQSGREASQVIREGGLG